MQEVEQCYDEHVDKVYKYFYIQCLNRHLAEDLTSQTFIAFIDKVQTGRVDDLKKYLYAIMRHVWADYLRSKYKETILSIETIEDFESHADSTIDTFERLSLTERAATFIDRLPEKQRQIATMRFLEGQELKEIALKLGKTMSYVKTTQNRAIKSLKLMLEQPELGGMHR